MHQIDLTAARAAKASERKGLAILAYDNACQDPGAANWRAVADLLRLAIPATKAAPKASAEAPESRFAPWADYAIPQSANGRRLGKSPVLTVTFACGAVVRAPAVSLPGKPLNIGRGLRIAFAYYRARIARTAGAFSADSDIVTIPAIASIACDNGAEFDATDCSERTAEARRGTFDATALAAEAEAIPEKAPDGAVTRAEFWRVHYRIAMAEAEQSGADETPAAELAATVEDCRLRLSGMCNFEIGARRRAIDKAEAEARRQAEAAAKAEAKAARVAAYLERRRARIAAAEAEAPRLRLVTAAEARAEQPAAADVAPAARSAAPRLAARFLASTSLGAPIARLPVAPRFGASA
ncbi:hypothetical protein MA20_42950 [Bradyrhizobium japonicum]|uniref:Uncharacterized protein n=1 Tax=Bradyrhizobium japonicum TaxID=375 RepID=A0A0A3XKB7_BRAJP|nr:hypothetical protein [Bradyrhizobium japonicum]KGT73709.1 hypothetical protein MA20_42950 [Bradyrhizobium japonicum]